MLRIRTLSLSVAALALSTASVLAADLTYESAPAPVMVAPAGFSWTGPYLGAIIGYGWGEFNTANGSLNADGVKLGVYGGYNFQMDNNVVLGAEADLNWDDFTGYNSAAGRATQNWDSTARLRAGYSFGRVMAYGTGGMAFSGATVDSGNYSDSANHFGWTLGAGVEAAVTSNITARLEYQYADFNNQTYETPAGSTSIDMNTNTIRAGVGYKF